MRASRGTADGVLAQARPSRCTEDGTLACTTDSPGESLDLDEVFERASPLTSAIRSWCSRSASRDPLGDRRNGQFLGYKTIFERVRLDRSENRRRSIAPTSSAAATSGCSRATEAATAGRR
jgi:hypothetical protein